MKNKLIFIFALSLLIASFCNAKVVIGKNATANVNSAVNKENPVLKQDTLQIQKQPQSEAITSNDTQVKEIEELIEHIDKEAPINQMVKQIIRAYIDNESDNKLDFKQKTINLMKENLKKQADLKNKRSVYYKSWLLLAPYIKSGAVIFTLWLSRDVVKIAFNTIAFLLNSPTIFASVCRISSSLIALNYIISNHGDSLYNWIYSKYLVI